MEILISRKAEKQFNSLPKVIQERVRAVLIQIRDEGLFSNLDMKKMRGFENHFRLRVGDYRVRFEFIKPDILQIYWIGKRSQAYND